MFGERRKHGRHSINRSAKFATDSGALPRDCIIVDISESGARLFSEADIPDSFVLMISGGSSSREECQVIWRLGGEIGVKFVTKERNQARLNAMKEVRSQVHNVLHQSD
jgi:hypothetical protein